MRTPRRTAFAVDGIGATVSAVATGTIWLALQPWVGLPRPILMWLAVIAAVLATYSLGCWSTRAPLVPWLPAVMVANLVYCGLLTLCLARNTSTLTPLGLAYFGGEIVVIVGVVLYERRALAADSAVASQI